jgi:hypothetical protein
MLTSQKISYEIGGNVEATPFGGLFAMHRLATRLGLVTAIDASLELLKIHLPYHESDHVLTLAYSVLCGGRRLEDVDRLRHDVPLMNGLGARLLPDPTTTGDFLRRFTEADLVALLDAINSVRPKLWAGRGADLLGEVAFLDADGTIVPTTGELKQGMDISYKGIWGYAPLLITLANTREVLYLVNRPGNAPATWTLRPGSTRRSRSWCRMRNGSVCEGTPASRSPPTSTGGPNRPTSSWAPTTSPPCAPGPRPCPPRRGRDCTGLTSVGNLEGASAGVVFEQHAGACSAVSSGVCALGAGRQLDDLAGAQRPPHPVLVGTGSLAQGRVRARVPSVQAAVQRRADFVGAVGHAVQPALLVVVEVEACHARPVRDPCLSHGWQRRPPSIGPGGISCGNPCRTGGAGHWRGRSRAVRGWFGLHGAECRTGRVPCWP